MSKTAKWILAVVAGLIAFSGLIALLVFLTLIADSDYDDSLSTSGEKVALIELKEAILSSEETVRQFKKYRENKSVKAIVFRVESPGGGVAASQEIYEEVKKTRDSGKPVVVSMGAVAASGGYYVACGSSRIVANPGTLTGSIGVIFQYLHVDQLLSKIGVDAATYKSGKYKDSGSPFRKPSSDDKKLFDQLLFDVHEQFVDLVVNERNLDRKHVLKYADGRIFTGRQALDWGFVDTLGTFEDAIAIAGELGEIKGKPKVVKERKKRTFWDSFLGEAFSDVRAFREELLNQPVVQYRLSLP